MMYADGCKCCLGQNEKCRTLEQTCVSGKMKWLQAEHKEINE